MIFNETERHLRIELEQRSKLDLAILRPLLHIDVGSRRVGYQIADLNCLGSELVKVCLAGQFSDLGQSWLETLGHGLRQTARMLTPLKDCANRTVPLLGA